MNCCFIIDDDDIHIINYLFHRNNKYYNRITQLSDYKNRYRRGKNQIPRRYKSHLRYYSHEKDSLISQVYPVYSVNDFNCKTRHGYSFSYLKIYHKQRFGRGISRAGRRKKRRILLGG